MFRISSRISGATLGRPGLRRRFFQVQYRLKPREVKILMRVVSKNTNELKTGLPGRFGIDVSTLGSQHLNDRVDFSGIAG